MAEEPTDHKSTCRKCGRIRDMCFHQLKAAHFCVGEPGHKGEHIYSKFTVTDTKETK